MTEGTGDTGNASDANPDLTTVHRRLTAMVDQLDAAIDAAPDAASVRKLTAQIAEVNARVTLVGRQLFARRTNALRDAAREVNDAIPRAERALRDVERLDELLSSVTSVLQLVDKAVGVAKAVA